ncbi:ribonuclease III [Clostridium paridis]|uniref:Ribonuclease 3 n=1 Tax=Clostridium paridis TaxID=2803863 RepID=A0A937FBG9_9CLOT|nr:ribonuclease III [Clostridium paridis]MBL4930849.1 ribonuclease III [Clostridium paridis]
MELMNFEKKIEIFFADENFLRTALTHSSFAHQYKNVDHNERLEFLGDSVLQLTITEYLFKKYSHKSEGELTKIRSLIVCENSLFQIAKTLELSSFIRMSKGEELTGGRERASLLADAVEAVIAAIYLDKGLEVAKNFILINFDPIIKMAIKNEIILDFKTRLQELLQKKGEVEISYHLIKFEGPPHRRKFFIDVFINNENFGSGEGYSKKEAEQNAARKALENLEARNG